MQLYYFVFENPSIETKNLYFIHTLIISYRGKLKRNSIVKIITHLSVQYIQTLVIFHCTLTTYL